MSNSIKLRFGTSSLDLIKSEYLVAVRREGPPVSTAKYSSGADARTEGRVGNYAVFTRVEENGKKSSRPAAEWKSTDNGPATVEHLVPVYHTSEDEVPFIPTGVIYVEFAGGASDRARSEIVARHGLDLVKTDPDGAVILKVTGGANAVDVSAALQAEPLIEIAEPDLQTEVDVKHFAIPVDALFGQQWHLENSGINGGFTEGLKAGADARVVAAWRNMESFGSSEVIIGVIDDGFDLTHPDLATRTKQPWDFRRGTSDVAPEYDRTSVTGNWHGTACAGIAVGGLQAGDIIGAAPECSWMPVRYSVISAETVVQWFDYMREKGAWIVSCSWGTRARNYPLPTPIAKSIHQCAMNGRGGKGCVILFAAGNEGRDINDPAGKTVNGFATHPDVIAVAASTSMDEWAPYSNYGKEICVCAPSSGADGRGITTADVVGEFTDAIGTSRPMGFVAGDYYEHFGKTSSACPLVAGICGLMLSVNPELKAAQVREILKITARRIGSSNDYNASGHSKRFGYGCVNAEGAVVEAAALLPSV